MPERGLVNEARLAPNGYNYSSLDAVISSSEDGETALADFIGTEDAALGLGEDFHARAPLIAELDERDQCIIHMRFVEELTQAEIGDHRSRSRRYAGVKGCARAMSRATSSRSSGYRRS